LKISQSNRLLHPLALPSDRPSTRVADPSSGPALRNSTFGSHRLLSSPAQPSDQPSTFVADQPSGPAFELNLRLSSDIASSSSALRSTFDLRRRSTLRPALWNSTSGFHRLSTSPAHPSDRPSTCVADRPSGPAFELKLRLSSLTGSPAHLASTSDSRRRPTSGAAIFEPISDSYRLSRPPAQPSDRPSTCVADQPSGLPCGTQPPALTGCCISGFRPPINPRLSSPIDLPASPSNSTSNLRRALHPPAIPCG